jgi:hypothetical protein
MCDSNVNKNKKAIESIFKTMGNFVNMKELSLDLSM